ncbi:MAG: type II toxin-antitoxin system RelE/ParE family toxin [Pseudomonadota bacterium]|nr:type II toxin-antitoxin system RelE/ParE family toxin [Pseudomonadota bacterium]
MPLYDITDDAEADIREIVSYTLENWGVAQTNIYRKAIKDTFELIGHKTVVIRKFSDTFPDLLVTKCQHHYIFYLNEGVKKPTIIVVLHEARDIVALLLSRLEA